MKDFKQSNPQGINYCQICRGRHWHPDSQQQTQASAKAEFGITPNNCVNGANGVVHCPAAKGLLQ